MKIKKWWKRTNYNGPGDEFSIGPLSIIERFMVKVIYIMTPVLFFLIILTILEIGV